MPNKVVLFFIYTELMRIYQWMVSEPDAKGDSNVNNQKIKKSFVFFYEVFEFYLYRRFA